MAEKPRRTFSAQSARQGYVVLYTPLRRRIFVAGLVAVVIVAIVWAVLA